jgi:hypothetical protein
MSDTELLHKSKLEPVRRVEVFTGAGRRLAWTVEQKAQILVESYESAQREVRPATAPAPDHWEKKDGCPVAVTLFRGRASRATPQVWG